MKLLTSLYTIYLEILIIFIMMSSLHPIKINVISGKHFYRQKSILFLLDECFWKHPYLFFLDDGHAEQDDAMGQGQAETSRLFFTLSRV